MELKEDQTHRFCSRSARGVCRGKVGKCSLYCVCEIGTQTQARNAANTVERTQARKTANTVDRTQARKTANTVERTQATVERQLIQ